MPPASSFALNSHVDDTCAARMFASYGNSELVDKEKVTTFQWYDGDMLIVCLLVLQVSSRRLRRAHFAENLILKTSYCLDEYGWSLHGKYFSGQARHRSAYLKVNLGLRSP